MEILKYVDQLEEIADTAQKVPFSSKVMINVDELFEVIDLIRENLPQEVKDAKYALLEKDRMLAEAQAKADREIENAKKEARALVSEHEITRHAQIEADAITERANQVALEVKEGARSYANDVLYQIENSLDKALYTVKKSRDEIRLNTNKRSAPSRRRNDDYEEAEDDE